MKFSEENRFSDVIRKKIQPIDLFSSKTIYFRFLRWMKLNVTQLFGANVLLFLQILSILRTLRANFLCQQIHDSTVLLMSFVSLGSVALFPNTHKIYCKMQFYFIFFRSDTDNSVSIHFKKKIFTHTLQTHTKWILCLEFWFTRIFRLYWNRKRGKMVFVQSQLEWEASH